MGMRTRIRLDWSRLLGFDQLDATSRDGLGARLAKVGDKAEGHEAGTRAGAKLGMVKIASKVGSPKIGAKVGLTKIGAKVGLTKIGSPRRG